MNGNIGKRRVNDVEATTSALGESVLRLLLYVGETNIKS